MNTPDIWQNPLWSCFGKGWLFLWYQRQMRLSRPLRPCAEGLGETGRMVSRGRAGEEAFRCHGF